MRTFLGSVLVMAGLLILAILLLASVTDPATVSVPTFEIVNTAPSYVDLGKLGIR